MKKHKITVAIIAVLIIIIGSVIGLSRIHGKIRDLPKIISTGRLAVLTDSSCLGFSSQAGKVSGFQYEIIKAFADTLGVELVVTEQNDNQTAINSLRNGDYDLLVNAIPITTEFKNQIVYSQPLFKSRLVLVQRTGTDSVQIARMVHSYQDFANDTVYISEHSPFKMRLEHLATEIAEPIRIIEKPNKSCEQLVKMVARGIIKQTVCDELQAKHLKLLYPNLDISVKVGFDQQFAWALHPKTPALLEKLNEFLDDFIGSAEYWTIYHKYYEQ